MTKQRSNFIRSHKKLVIFSSILVLALALILGRVIYERSVVSEMRAIANQIKLPPGMKIDHDYWRSPMLLCIGDEPCPMYNRSVDAPGPLSLKDFKNIISGSQIQSSDVSVTGTCESSPYSSGNVELCSAKYIQKDYSVVITYDAVTGNRELDKISIRILRNSD